MHEQERSETRNVVPPRLLPPGPHFQILPTSPKDGIFSQVAFGHIAYHSSRKGNRTFLNTPCLLISQLLSVSRLL